MKKFFREFKEFALRGNVLNLAVGVIIGGAFQLIISSLVNDIIMPLVGIFTGQDFNKMSVMVGDAEIKYGSFISAVINFIIMALVIFIMVKIMARIGGFSKKALKKKGEPEPPPDNKDCPYCLTEIAYKATRCPHCTSEL